MQLTHQHPPEKSKLTLVSLDTPITMSLSVSLSSAVPLSPVAGVIAPSVVVSPPSHVFPSVAAQLDNFAFRSAIALNNMALSMMMMPRQPTSYRSAFATLKDAVFLLKLAGRGSPSSKPAEPERAKVIQLLKAANRRCVRLSQLAEQQADQEESDDEYQLPFHIVAHTAHPDQVLCSPRTNADSYSSCSMIALIQINAHDEQLLWTQRAPTREQQFSSSCSPSRVRDLIVAIVLYNLGVCFLARAEEYQTTSTTTEEDETNHEEDNRHSQQQQQTKRRRQQQQEERSRAATAAGMRLLASCQDIAATQYADLDDTDDNDNGKDPSGQQQQQPSTTTSSPSSLLLHSRILLFSAIVLHTNQQLWHACGDLEQAYVCATSLACLRDAMLAQEEEEGMILENDCTVFGNQPTMSRKTTTATVMCRQKKVAPAA